MTSKEVYKTYNRLKYLSSRCFRLNLYNSCIQYAKAACLWAYYFNINYFDEQLEHITKDLSRKISQVSRHTNLLEDNVVFYDSFAYDHRGLTQQYIRALMSMQFNLLFITDSDLLNPISAGIYNELRGYPKVQIVNVPCKLSGEKRAQYIYDHIVRFKASKVFMHLKPHAIEAIMAMHALPEGVTRYQINLTDHTFWIGATALDYSFEFRPLGIKASVAYRHISESKILLNPYYPIIEEIPFQGFPNSITKEQVIILTGGTAYKYMNEEATYARIVKEILDQNPQVIWLHVGDNPDKIEVMMRKVMDESYFGRINLIGYRDDIAEVVKRCDIYMNSYPMAGGLMSLYAAHYAKPIVSLSGMYASVDEFVSQLHPISLSYDTMSELCGEIKRLVNDKKYRAQKGAMINACIVDENRFNANVKTLFEKHTNILPYTLPPKVELPSIDEKLEFENKSHEGSNKLMGVLRWRATFVSLHYAIGVIPFYMTKIKRKIKKSLKK